MPSKVLIRDISQMRSIVCYSLKSSFPPFKVTSKTAEIAVTYALSLHSPGLFCLVSYSLQCLGCYLFVGLTYNSHLNTF